MAKIYIFLLFFFPTFIFAQNTDTITVMVYNLLNFPDGRNDCGSNIVVPARWDTLSTVLLGFPVAARCKT